MKQLSSTTSITSIHPANRGILSDQSGNRLVSEISRTLSFPSMRGKYRKAREASPRNTFSKHIPSWLLSAFIILSLGIINSCDDPGGLDAVSGIQGRIILTGEKPDSIKAVALVVLDPQAQQDPGNIGEYLINYSEPLDDSGEYYTQLKPGQYMGVLVGLLIDPGLFVVNIDRYLESPELPLVQLSVGAHGFIIREKEMQELDWPFAF